MFVQSNDWFYSTHNNDSGILLFDDNGAPVSGDVSGVLTLWESDTEEDQEPGIGTGQAPRQDASGEMGMTT
ncbi:MAG: ssDNA-binding replication factor A large subunit [Granulosicoccus sp.]|jgi:ssDNA-binding replication factor A large subunit